MIASGYTLDLCSKTDDAVCPCFEAPLSSRCGNWDDNESACICADLGVAHEDHRGLPA